MYIYRFSKQNQTFDLVRGPAKLKHTSSSGNILANRSNLVGTYLSNTQDTDTGIKKGGYRTGQEDGYSPYKQNKLYESSFL